MLARWQFWVTTIVAVIVAVIAGYDMMLFSQNRTTQTELGRRAQFIQQTIQLEVFYRELVKALADLSTRNQDKALSDLLTSQGIAFNTGAPPTPASTIDTGKGAKP